MPHACHRFWNCYKTLMFCSHLTRCTVPIACHAKRHLNVQKCSVPLSCLHFWLRNVLRATPACTFSTSQLPKVLWTRQFFTLLTSTCASRHTGVHCLDISTSKSGPNLVCFIHFDFEMCFAPQCVQLFISHLTAWLRIRRLSEPTFRPSCATNHWKNRSVSRLSNLFAHLDLLSSETFSCFIFFLLPFSSLTLPISAFHLSILSEIWL